jgi:dihydroorotate dehydrogenase (fumarate)
MTDLHTDYLGLRLHSPIVASSGPYTGDPDRWREIEDAGAGAMVLPSLFEEQIEHETQEIDRLYSVHDDSFGEALSFFPEFDHDSGTDAYLALVESAKQRIDIPVIASLNGTNLGGWLRYATLLRDAGADAIELNLYTVAADPDTTGAQLESEQHELVRVVSGELDIPLAVKISPFYSSVAAFVRGLEEAGASGVVMFNRFYAPDLDMETLEVAPTISLSNHTELRLPLRWIGIVRDFLGISIAGSTGVHSGRDVAKLILAGADVAMTTSALLFHGPHFIENMTTELVQWMAEHDYRSVSEMRGAASRSSTADPAAYERANYIGNLTSYTSRFLGRRSVDLRQI